MTNKDFDVIASTKLTDTQISTINSTPLKSYTEEEYLINISNTLTNMCDRLEKLENTIGNISYYADMAKRHSEESVWAILFFDAIKSCEWLKSTTFSAGRWAVNYSYLFVAYKILEIIKPKNILELGLGLSSKLFNKYVDNFEAQHSVVEHDHDWISFFCNNNKISSTTKIIKASINHNTVYDNETGIESYENFSEITNNSKYDFISIDGPCGSAKKYSRIDILNALPSCLAESFVIIFDDSQRIGERNTLKQVEAILKENNIKFFAGTYKSTKDITVLTSVDYKFLCTL